MVKSWLRLPGIKFLRNDLLRQMMGSVEATRGCTILHNKSWSTAELEQFISAWDYNCIFISGPGPAEDNCNPYHNTVIQLSD